jgi:hypothetical protein
MEPLTTEETTKWKDPAFVKKYHRLKRRESHPPTQRLRVADDGKLVREHHPEIVNTYIRKPKMMCQACGKEIYEGYMDRHTQSHHHIINSQIYARGKGECMSSTSIESRGCKGNAVLPIFRNPR